MVVRRGATALTRYQTQNARVRLYVVIHNVRHANRESHFDGSSGSHVRRSTFGDTVSMRIPRSGQDLPSRFSLATHAASRSGTGRFYSVDVPGLGADASP